jgi:transcriptional regulator with XRE-family HTH domain
MEVVMEFSEILRSRRMELELGVRELARATEKPWVPQPIKSAVYISRLENKVIEEMRAEAISIDKLWALGVALRLPPLVLFAYSRNLLDLIDRIPAFVCRECAPVHFSKFLVTRRHIQGLTLRRIEELAPSISPWPISSGYLSQIETDDEGVSERVSAEKLWTLGRVLDVDPLLLYVLSRKMAPRYLKAASRDRLFS